MNWEGRPGSFGAALAVPEARTDLQVLGALADEMDVHLGLPDADAARRELNALVPDITSSASRTTASAIPTRACVGRGRRGCRRDGRSPPRAATRSRAGPDQACPRYLA